MDPLRISMVGLSRWESVFVQTSVDLASGMEIAPCRFVEDPQRADVLLVDANHERFVPLDESGGSNRPVVVSFTEDPDSSNSGRGLTRPVGYAELISMLKDIEHELMKPVEAAPTPKPEKPVATPQSDESLPTLELEESLPTLPLEKAVPTPRPASAAPQPAPPEARQPVPPEARQPVPRAARRPEPAKPAEPDPAVVRVLRYRNGRADESLADKARPARRFVEGTRLLGILNRISRWGIPAEVTHASFPAVLIIPEHNAFVSSGHPLSIPAMYRDSAMSFSIRDLADDVAEAVLTSGKLRPLSHLIYCAALFGSEGRLMLNSNPQDRLSLIGTPDFDAVPDLPEHKTIARYLIANAADLADIARSTGVSISIVIDFCNACEAAGLVRRIPDVMDKQHVDEHGVLQLFGRVRDLFRET